MSEDIHKWTNGRYTLMFDEHTFFVFDNEREKEMTALEVTKKLNEQQHTIEQLQIEKQIIQNAIDYSINHQKTEIGKKALQKVIEKYNEQMLDH